MQVIAGFFGSGALAELPVHGAAFSHYVKQLAQFAKLATSYIPLRTSATMSQALRQDGSGLEGAHKKGR
jgi:hypothetical protein